MDNAKEYFAFISYKREDEKWAKWLQHKLEHYKLPSNLNGRTDLPKEIRPIFRDQSELASGVLADEINKALTNSKYLIVICSPRAAQSQWVGKEVQTFIDLGRTDKIIPFVIGGTVRAQNPEDECFPLALLNLPQEQELLGINIDEMGRDAAAVKVVAQMFGLKFDTLWQRYEREKRRRRIFVIVVALLLAAVGVGAAIVFSRLNKSINEKNKEINAQKEEIEKQYENIQTQNDRLHADSIVMAEQMESIYRRDSLIGLQKDSIAQANQSLLFERNNLQVANWKMMENRSRFLSEKALQLASEGDIATAFNICLEILPKDINRPERPYVAEAEHAFRQVCAKDRLTNEMVFLTKTKNHYSWEPIRKINIGADEIYSAVFSNDNKKIVTTSESGLLRVFDVETNKCVYTEPMSYFEDGYAEFSPDGKYLGSTGWGSACLINCKTHQKVLLFEIEDPCMIDGRGYLHFSNDGRFVVTSMAIGTQVFEILDDGKVEEIMLSNEWYNGDFAISTDSKELVVKKYSDNNNTYAIFELSSGRLLKEIDLVFSKYSFPSYDSMGRLNVVDGNLAFVLSSETLACVDTIEVPLEHGNYSHRRFGEQTVYYYSKDGSLKTEIVGGVISIYKKESLQNYSIDSTSLLEISPDESLIATVPKNGNSILMWDSRSQQLLYRLINQDSIIHIDFSPDSKYLVSCSSDNSIRIWNTHNGKCEKTLNNKPYVWATFDYTGRNLLAYVEGENGLSKLQLLDYKLGLARWEVVAEEYGFGPPFDVTERFVSQALLEPIIVDVKSGEMIDVPFEGDVAVINEKILIHPFKPIIIVPCGNIGVHGANASLVIYDFEKNDTLGIISANDHRSYSYINDMALSSDGKFIVTISSSSKKMSVFDMESFKCFYSIDLPEMVIGEDDSPKVGFLPTNDAFYCEMNGGIYFYRIQEGSMINHVSGMHNCTFSKKGNYMICQDQRDRYSVFRYHSLEALLMQSREKYRNVIFTPEERHQYYLE